MGLIANSYTPSQIASIITILSLSELSLLKNISATLSIKAYGLITKSDTIDG
jgi:hypothetical protein